MSTTYQPDRTERQDRDADDVRPAPGEVRTATASDDGFPATPVVVRRNAGLAALVGSGASAMAIAYLWRLTQTGDLLDAVLCVVLAGIAAVHLVELVDARTPLLVADELGVRLRLGRQWRGLPWDAVRAVEVRQRRGWSADGRLSLEPHPEADPLAALDGPGRRAAALNRRWYGAPLAVPLGLTTRVSAADDDLAGQLRSLAGERVDVVLDDHPAPGPTRPRRGAAEVDPGGPGRPQEPAGPTGLDRVADPGVDSHPGPGPDPGVGLRPDLEVESGAGPEGGPTPDDGVGDGHRAVGGRSRAGLAGWFGVAALAEGDAAKDSAPAGATVTGAGEPVVPGSRAGWRRRTLPGDLGSLVSRAGRSRDLYRRGGVRPDADPAEARAGAPENAPEHASEDAPGGAAADSAASFAAGDPADSTVVGSGRGAANGPGATPGRRSGGKPDSPASPASPAEGAGDTQVTTVPEPAMESVTLTRGTSRAEAIAFRSAREPVRSAVPVGAESGVVGIGPDLAQARARVGLSVDELAERTRIRPHVIESIEVDDFTACGGDFYARGHLRTLARVLGRDPGPLLRHYDTQHAGEPVDARRVFEAELATGMTGSMRSTAGGASWALLVGVVVLLLGTWVVVRLAAAEPDPVLTNPAPAPAAVGTGTGTTAGKQATKRAVVAPPLRLTITASRWSSDVVVRDRTGDVAWSGRLEFQQQRRVRADPPVSVEASNAGAVEVTLGGRNQGSLGAMGQTGSRTFERSDASR